MVPAAPAVAAPLVTEGVATTPVPVPAAPIVRDQVVSAPMIVGDQPARLVAQGVITAAAPAAVAYTVGSRLPANIPLYAIPESAALQVPVVRRYTYAFVNDRVLLVEPISGIVVAELDR
jgi:hypothetical protein